MAGGVVRGGAIVRRVGCVALVAASGCGVPEAAGPGEVPGADTDRGVVADTPDSDSDLAEDSVADSDPAPQERPQWGPGFQQVGGDLQDGYPAVFPGDAVGGVAPEITTVAVGDLDGDGVEEVIASSRPSQSGRPATLRGYHYDASAQRLVEEPSLATVLDDLAGPEMVMGLLDLDGDGHLDAVLGDADRLVQWGRGNGRFDLAGERSMSCASVISGASLWDVDSDGWSDWLLGAGLCFDRLRVLRRTGPRQWKDDPSWLTGQMGALQTATVLSFPAGDEQLHLVVGSRTLGVDEIGWYVGPRQGLTAPYLRAEERTPSPVYWTTRPVWANASILDVAAMGAAAEDLDGDGWLDVALTVGAEPIAFFGGGAAGLTDRTADANLVFASDVNSTRQLPWSLAVVDFDLDGRLDILSTFGDDATSFGLVRGEVMRNMLWWSKAPWQYEESGDAAGLTARGGWMPLAVFDLDRDGDADLGLGGDGQAPSLMRNRIENGRHGLALRLIGTTSNREALGATVDLECAALPVQRRTVTMRANPYAVAEPLLFFGLGTADEATTVRIHWPSGWTQEVHGLSAGTLHTVVEPPPFTVDDADRTAPADGRARVGLTVRPRRVDGSVDSTAVVRITLDGPGTLTTTQPAWSVDAFRAAVVAPGAPGETRVTITVNGVRYAVRPRITWQ